MNCDRGILLIYFCHAKFDLNLMFFFILQPKLSAAINSLTADANIKVSKKR